MNSRSLLTFVFIFCGLSICVSGQDGIRSEFLKVRPGVDTKADVERSLGPVSPVNHSATVKTKEKVIVIDFSTGMCGSFGEWVVETVTIFPSEKYPLRLEDVLSDRSKFAKRSEGDVLTIVTYFNLDETVSIEFDTEMNRVESIEIRASGNLNEYEATPCSTAAGTELDRAPGRISMLVTRSLRHWISSSARNCLS